MKINKIASITIVIAMLSSCSEQIIPVTKSDNVLAGSKLIEELNEETPASFLVKVVNFNKTDQLSSGVSGTILSTDGNTILDGQFRFNDHKFDGYTNTLNNLNLYLYDVLNYADMESLPSSYGANCTFALNKNNANTFQVSMYIPTPISLNNKTSNLADNQTITWNPDDQNTLGVIILIDGTYYITEDDGNVDLKDIIGSVPNEINYTDIGFYRGNGKVVSGTDGRRYKVMATSETHLYTQIR